MQELQDKAPPTVESQPPLSNLGALLTTFSAKGLSARDTIALSGAHTIGQARCHSYSFKSRIYSESNIEASVAAILRASFPMTGGDSKLAALDVQTPSFDNAYYQNLLAGRGLLHSDQVLFNNGSQDALVRRYANNGAAFNTDFAVAIVKMGNLSPLTGTSGEIRRNCRLIN